jgi:rhodanese-related sulfurtransferase
MKHISVEAFKEVIEAEGSNVTVDFINVCTPAEYKEKHIGNVRNLPLDEIERRVAELKDKKTIYIHCRSGNRGRQAIERLQTLGVTAELVNVEGGITAWHEAGFLTQSLTTRMPIMRQVLLTAGVLILLGYLLSILVAPSFIFMSVFVGAGLTFAGLTGWCGMSFLLAKMPWNA